MWRATFKVTKDQGRIYVHTEGEYDYDDAVAAMRRVFGIVGICPVVILEDEGFEKLGDDVVAYYKEPAIGENCEINL